MTSRSPNDVRRTGALSTLCRHTGAPRGDRPAQHCRKKVGRSWRESLPLCKVIGPGQHPLLQRQPESWLLELKSWVSAVK